MKVIMKKAKSSIKKNRSMLLNKESEVIMLVKEMT